MATSTCKECGHENEPERIYCHNCGTKLDRSFLAAEEKKEIETPAEVRKRIIKATNPRRAIFTRASFRKLLETVAIGAVIAIVVQVAREPDGIPPKETGD